MLIRSSSAPIMKSWVVSHLVELSPESDFHHQIPKHPNSLSLTSSFNSNTKITRARSENDLRDLSVQKRNQFNQKLNQFVEEEEDDVEENLRLKSKYVSTDRLFYNSGLGGELVKEEVMEEVKAEECLGGGFGSNGRLRLKSGGDGDGDEEKNDTTDVYYQKMIKSDPTNALLLGNYAKFLKEIRGDVVKAEEYFERSILANPNDGNVASLYACLIWEVYRNASRAEKYFEQAVQAEPENSYVMASYAKFLWDAEDEEEEEDEKEEVSESYQSCVFQGASFPSSTSIAAY